MTGLLLVSAVIHVSTYDVDFTTRVWMEREIEAGSRAAMRVAVRRRPGGEMTLGTSVTPCLYEANDAAAAEPELCLETLTAGDTGLIEESIEFPEHLAPGPYILELDVRTATGEHEIASFPLRIGEPSAVERTRGATVIRPVCEESSGRRPDGGWHPARRCRVPGEFRLFPDGGHLVAHVRSLVHVWHRPGEHDEEAEPGPANGLGAALAGVRGEVVEIVQEPVSMPGGGSRRQATRPMPVRLDSLGLGSFPYEPPFPRGALLLRMGQADERVWLRDIPTPVDIVPSKRLIGPGENIELEVSLRRPSVPVFLDVWTDGRWVGAHSGRLRGNSERLGIPMPSDMTGLTVVRAALDPDGRTASYAAVWVHDGASSPPLSRLARALSEVPLASPLASYERDPAPEPLIAWIAAMDDETLFRLTSSEESRAAAAMLSRVILELPGPPVLGDTTGVKMLALEDWQKRVRRPLLGALLALACSVLVGGAWLAVTYQREVRRRLLEIELESEADEDQMDSRPLASLSRRGWLATAALLVVVFSGAIVGLLVFLETLQWNRGDVFAARQRQAAEAAARVEEP